MYFSKTGFTGSIGFFIACGEAAFGRRPFYPDNPVDPVEFFLTVRIHTFFQYSFFKRAQDLPVFARFASARKIDWIIDRLRRGKDNGDTDLQRTTCGSR
jgi:hypothetical protein